LINDSIDGAHLAALVRKIEKLGYSTFFSPEAFGRDPFTVISHLLSVTDQIVHGTAIANVWKREAATTIAAARTLAEFFPDRFILGIGASHGPLMQQLGINYSKPVAFMRDYIGRMKSAPYTAPRPKADPPIVIAALLPKMLELSAAVTEGTFPVYVTPERTAEVRKAVGPDKWVIVQQVAIFETDASEARSAARDVLAFYLTLPNYLQSFRIQGFGDADSANGGSDRLIDALIAWGGEQAIRDRLAAHYAAGATHVCMALVRSQGSARERSIPGERALEALAP
jgi:probable F420-dependent oxidoreductase